MTTTADEAYLYVLVCIHLIWNIFLKTFLNYSQKPLHVSLKQFFIFSVFRIKKNLLPWCFIRNLPSCEWLLIPWKFAYFSPHTRLCLRWNWSWARVALTRCCWFLVHSWSVPQLLDTRLFLLRVHYDDDDYSLPPTLLTSAFPSFCVSGGSIFWGGCLMLPWRGVVTVSTHTHTVLSNAKLNAVTKNARTLGPKPFHGITLFSYLPRRHCRRRYLLTASLFLDFRFFFPRFFPQTNSLGPNFCNDSRFLVFILPYGFL